LTFRKIIQRKSSQVEVSGHHVRKKRRLICKNYNRLFTSNQHSHLYSSPAGRSKGRRVNCSGGVGGDKKCVL
ncbi:MAG: hypothetical protein RMK43_08465, partial [Cyclobacteriaceae bacterium]|nr:hypothetical protein [Cyclobacteriaceae bacterium]